MSTILLESLVILLLFVANGVFAMTELAVVSSRKLRLRQRAAAGSAAARAALALAEDPNRFLPTVQMGITLVGLLAGAFGGATIAQQLARALAANPTLAPYAEALAVGMVVLALTFVSLLIGELVPKRLALAFPETIACLVSRPINALSVATRPFVRLLGGTTEFLLWLLRIRPEPSVGVTEDEVKFMVEEGVSAGTFDRDEPGMVASVLAFDRRPVRDIMTPRAKIIFLNQDEPHADVWHKIVVSHHSHFPVYAGTRDHVVGMVSVKSIYANLAAGVNVRVADLMTPPLTVSAMATIKSVLEQFKTSGQHIALVQEADGTVGGVVTLVDVLEAIVGEIPTLEEKLKPGARARADGSWLVDGELEVAEFARLHGGLSLPGPAGGGSWTMGEFARAQFTLPPREGDTFVWQNWLFEVADLDGPRIDKLLVLPMDFRK